MTAQTTTGQHGIVVGVDGGAGGSAALELAGRQAQQRGVPVTVVHAWDLYPVYEAALVQTLDEVEAAHAALLEQAVQDLEARAPQVVTSGRLVQGPAGPALVEASRHAELVVVGGHDGSASRLGAVLAHVSVHARCPVVVVPQVKAPAGVTPGPVVVGVDGSEVSAQAVAHAFTEADRAGVELVAVLASPLAYDAYLPGAPVPEQVPGRARDRARRFLAEALAGSREQHPDVAVRCVVTLDEPQQALRDAARGAALLVVGSHGRGAVGRFLLGSVSSGLLRSAPCPVALVRPEAPADPAPATRTLSPVTS